MCAEHSTVRGIIENLPAGENQVTILDMGATPEPFSRGTLKPIEVLLLIAEPYYKSLEAVVRMSDLARQLEIPHIEVVANKVRSDEEAQAITEICEKNGLELLKMIPYDQIFATADLKGVAPLDLDGQTAPGILELEDLASRVEALVR
ncbi:MAG: hypothetical protein ACRDIF_01645 [Actinomycetota bacterium]